MRGEPLGAATHRHEQAGERHGAGALDVVVERAQLVAIPRQQPRGVSLGEVFPLEQHPGKAPLHPSDEGVDERVVAVAGDPAVPPSEIQRIAQQFFVVGPDVEQDRQRRRGMNPGAQRVERELSDWNAHSADAQVAQAENALAVGDDDHVRVRDGRIGQNRVHLVLLRVGNEQAARPPVDVAVGAATLADRRRVDERHHLGDVPLQQHVEQRLVAILQRGEKDVALETAGLALEILVRSGELLVRRRNMRRQQAKEAQCTPLPFGERAPFVQQRTLEHLPAPGPLKTLVCLKVFLRNIDDGHSVALRESRIDRRSLCSPAPRAEYPAVTVRRREEEQARCLRTASSTGSVSTADAPRSLVFSCANPAARASSGLLTSHDQNQNGAKRA